MGWRGTDLARGRPERDVSVPLANQIDDVLSSVLSLVTARTGRLVAVTLAGASQDEVLPRVKDRLRKAGLPDVEVHVRSLPGPLRVLTLEFER
ncbi:hypothetical protein LBMAG42_32000 [Deltaproteobacteria bacterium]|nr:hypothetical protein LBMAG42_32000 [Deltaproteobacteria bacterium]